MRETLFRAKALTKYGLLKQDNGWIYGFPVPVRINAYLTNRIEIVECHGYDELDSWELLSEDDEVNPDTVSQFTGVLDKNNRKIFEGDIVRFNAGYCEGRWTGIVEYDDKNGQFVVSGNRGWRYSSYDPGTFKLNFFEIDKPTLEIMGNRWDNPGLLKGE